MRLGFVALLAAALLGPAAVARAADEAAWLFDPGHVTEIDLDMTWEAQVALDADPDEYVEAQLTVTRDDGTTYGPLLVGVRLKGTVSFRTMGNKAAFKVKLNEFVDGQKLLGLKSLTLNNMVQDPTMLRELLAFEAFRAAGLAAPRTGFAYVRVTGSPYGVYLNLETPDDVWLKRTHAGTQHLYEGDAGIDVVPEDLALFEVDEGDEEDRSDLVALEAAIGPWTGIDAVADLDQLTRFWAVEHYIGHWDGYSSGTLTNNFYLHSDDAGRFTMLPWGTDQTWEHRLAYGDPGGRLFNACLAHAACEALYRDAVADVRATLAAHDLDLLASDTAALLYPWQRTDPRKEHTLTEMREAIVALHAFLEARPGDTTWVTPPTPEPPEPPAPPVAGDADRPPTAAAASLGPPPLAPPAAPPAPGLAIAGAKLAGPLLTTTVTLPAPGRITLRATARLGGRRRTVCVTRRRARGPGTITMQLQAFAARPPPPPHRPARRHAPHPPRPPRGRRALHVAPPDAPRRAWTGVRERRSIVVGGALAASTAAALTTMVRGRTAVAQGDPTHLVVFGARASSPALRARAARAASLAHGGASRTLLCAGTPEERTSMREAFAASGVTATSIVDLPAATTRQTVARLGERPDLASASLAAVSSPYHMPRILAEARRHGVALAPFPSTLDRARSGPAALASLARLYTRELVARQWYAVSWYAGRFSRRRR